MTARVIINADDFGLSPGVNRGILSAFREGVLTSTTALVNMPHFGEAATLARQVPRLGVGIHLSLLWGRPVSDAAAVPTLVDQEGSFPRSLLTLARRYFFGLLSPDDVRTEFRSQVRGFIDTGLSPTHLDTHKHVHCLPGVLHALLDVAREFGIDKVRLPREQALDRRSAPRLPTWKAVLKRNLIRYLSRDAAEALRASSFKTTDHFSGIDYQEQLDADALLHILRHLRPGVTEVMCHPGYADEPSREPTRGAPLRDVELAALCDPRLREYLASGTVLPINYGDL